MENINAGDMAVWNQYVPSRGWIRRTGRVTRKLTDDEWEVCGLFGVKYINARACGIEKVES